MELSLKQAVDLALAPAGSPRLQLAREAIARTAARSREAMAGLLPNVDGALTYSSLTRNLRTLGLNFTIPGLGVIPETVGPYDVYDYRLTATQSVFDLSTIRRYQAGRAGLRQAIGEADAATDRTVEQTARAYLEALRTQANVEAREANVALAEALLRLTESQKKAGTGTGIEITRAQVQLANEQQGLLVARNQHERASLQLLREAGVDVSASVKLTDRMNFQPVNMEAAEKELSNARAIRADLRAQQAREETARLLYASVKWERLPSITGFADYGSIGSLYNQTLPTRSVGLAVRVPIFDGGRRDARRAESLSELRAEQIRSRDLEQQIEMELRLAIDGVRAAEGQVKAAQEGLKLAENELEQARRRYEAGVSISVELTDAQTRLERARDNWIAALFSHNVARLDLESARGTIARTIRQ